MKKQDMSTTGTTAVDPRAQLQAVDLAMLTPFVRQALYSNSAAIIDWNFRPLNYVATEPNNFGLYRFAGTAHDQGEIVPWSLVLKAVHAPATEGKLSAWNYLKREFLAYQSGLLSDLPGDLKAPRCFGVREQPGDVHWLWLEELTDADGPQWSLARYGLVARHLGAFNGAYLVTRQIPTMPWLSHGFLRRWTELIVGEYAFIPDMIQDHHIWQYPLLRRMFPRAIADDVLRLWVECETLFDALDRLPQTFCHFDTYRPNLFARRDATGRDQTVAIDWAFTGVGAVGAEIANLVVASLIWLEVEAANARQLDEIVFDGYLAGLRDAGWNGDPQLVRLGYTAASVVRWGVLHLWWLSYLRAENQVAAAEEKWGHPIEDLAQQWAAVTYYLLDLADETRQLISTIR